ncbi:NADH:quinone oxidoreductase [Pseudomonas sp. NC26]|uniref:NADH:quinone oxidoreductase n=1 Tax=Pseudomonas putida TaxID=303 RepID=A0A7W2L3H7_PSEPU|nr:MULTISPECIES: Rnf-Nqr domain containing protein [Pseudomonas]MBA6117706.1 NADH:quinone oxidoreductase [Pseudomonas putida]MCZ9636259.1 NADH:quinone oxidoreductase [Pseudomonas putida]MEC4877703.1 NADH:quinone oxidoreductase [Pseudomonas sp. NC26]
MNRFCLLVAGLAPLLGATSSVAQGTAIGMSMLVLILAHQVLLSPLRSQLQGARYWLASLLIVAALASCLQLVLRAWALPLALSLGDFPLLIGVQCLATDSLLPNQGRWRQLLRYLSGLLFISVLLGASRQWLAEGLGLHLASLPSGALLLLGLLLALYNCLRPGPARQGKR